MKCVFQFMGVFSAVFAMALGLFADDLVVSRGAAISWNGAKMFDHGCEVLLDGKTFGTANMVWGHWNDAKEVTIDLDLRDCYLISKVRVWSVEHQSARGIRDFVVFLGNDGTNLTQVARFESPVDFNDGKPERRYVPVPRDCILENPSIARFVRVIAHRPIGPLEVTRFGDMLGVNFFWGGGGANEKTGPVWWNVAADFLSRSHFRKLRWWITPEWAMKEYLPRRIEVNGWTGQKDVAQKYGLYLHDIGNEPELRPGYTPDKYVADCRMARENWKDAGLAHKFYGPVSNISEAGFKYLRGFIEAGGAQYVDAIDLHTYCGGTVEFKYPPGYPVGSPEAIIPRVAEIRAYLSSKGVDKPLTCSEWGYSDTKTVNPHMADPTPLRKAQFLVRGFIIHHVLGFRRVYMYSFYDEGTDPNYSEHSFGILTRDLQKKPAYSALETMGAVLGDCLVSSKLANLGPGDYGYNFRAVDGSNWVTVIWNGARNRKGGFKTVPGEVEVIDLFGKSRCLRTKEDGTFLARFDASPVYLRSSSPVEVVSTADAVAVKTEIVDRLVVLANEKAVFNAGERSAVSFTVRNPFRETVEVMLTLKNFSGEMISQRKTSIGGGATSSFAFPFDLKGRALDKAVLSVDYDADGESFCETRGIWVRQLGGGTQFANLAYPVKVLSNDELDISVDPVQGGQALEI